MRSNLGCWLSPMDCRGLSASQRRAGRHGEPYDRLRTGQGAAIQVVSCPPWIATTFGLAMTSGGRSSLMDCPGLSASQQRAGRHCERKRGNPPVPPKHVQASGTNLQTSDLQASTRLLSVPTPPTVISTRSPALRNRVGEKLPPAPSGEPVAMRSPVFSGVKWEM